MKYHYKDLGLVNTKEMFAKANKEGYAVPAFNFNNMEQLQGIIEAAVETGSPVILQVSTGARNYIGKEMLPWLAKAATAYVEASGSDIPVALHLDHGNSAELCAKALRSGYTSIMIDGSKLPFAENVELTKKVVEFTHAMGVPVEGELGTVGGKEDTHEVKDSEKAYTDPQEAKAFAEQTGVDFLAVGIGNAHGFYQGVPKLRFDILEKTKGLVSIPIVLHGASGIPDEDVKKSTGLGICKVNFATELRDAFTKGVKAFIAENPDAFDPKKYNGAGREKVKELVMHKMQVLNSVNKA